MLATPMLDTIYFFVGDVEYSLYIYFILGLVCLIKLIRMAFMGKKYGNRMASK